MKLGNSSQSKVPVPNLFLNRTLKQMETFNISDRKRYFRENDLFRMTKDLNFCNNQRNFNRKNENFNKKKIFPDLTNIKNILENYSTINTNRNIFMNTSPNSKSQIDRNTFDNFRSHLAKTNVTNYTNPDLRDEIRTNINVLINKINYEYDLNKWASVDTRTNFLPTDSKNYFTSNNFNSNKKTLLNENFFQTKSDNEIFNETDAKKFKNVLRKKVKTMAINEELKHKLIENIDKFNDSNSEKFYKTKSTNIISKYDKNNENENQYNDINFMNNENVEKDNISNKVHSKNLSVGFINNKRSFNAALDMIDNFQIGKLALPFVAKKYSKVNPDSKNNLTVVNKLRDENKRIYERFQDSSLFKGFPSPDRKEFIIKKGEKLRAKSKKDKIDKTITDFSNYNAIKHNNIFCEDYDTNDGFMIKFKKTKEVF